MPLPLTSFPDWYADLEAGEFSGFDQWFAAEELHAGLPPPEDFSDLGYKRHLCLRPRRSNAAVLLEASSVPEVEVTEFTKCKL